MVQREGSNMEHEHEHLINELNTLEGYNPQERLDHAKKRRKEQLSSYTLRKVEDSAKLTHASHDKRIHFLPNISMIESSARNDAEEVRDFIVDHAMTPDLQNDDGLSALHQAVIEDCADVVNVLIEHGANLDIKDADLWTPLHAAVACGNYELVKILIENGASLIEINTDGNMPIDLTEENEEIEHLLDEFMINANYTQELLEEIRSVIPCQMLEDLKDSLANNRDFDIQGELGETACHTACANGFVQVLEFLLENGARFDVCDNDGWQPIHAASCWGHDGIIQLLVNHGADLEACTNDGETPYDLTEDEEMQEMLLELKRSGNYRTPTVKRSQSNRSRSLSVRRSSIVEKRQISINDAKQEGIYRAQPGLLHVDIKVSDDENNAEGIDDSASDASVFRSINTSAEAETPTNNDHDIEDNDSNKEDNDSNIEDNDSNIEENDHNIEENENPPLTDEKESSFDIDNLNNDNLISTPNVPRECVVDINSVEEKVTIEDENLITQHETTVLPPSDEHVSNNVTNNANVDKNHCLNNIEIQVPECVPSHNTAAKNESNQKFKDSSELAIKKKCCIIL